MRQSSVLVGPGKVNREAAGYKERAVDYWVLAGQSPTKIPASRIMTPTDDSRLSTPDS